MYAITLFKLVFSVVTCWFTIKKGVYKHSHNGDSVGIMECCVCICILSYWFSLYAFCVHLLVMVLVFGFVLSSGWFRSGSLVKEYLFCEKIFMYICAMFKKLYRRYLLMRYQRLFERLLLSCSEYACPEAVARKRFLVITGMQWDECISMWWSEFGSVFSSHRLSSPYKQEGQGG